jgi:hypothetical protein
MTRSKIGIAIAGACLVAACSDMTAMHSSDARMATGAKSDMTFFITSRASGNGADYGGLAGADRHCQMLGDAAGTRGRTWRAYLSTQGPNAVNARDRIGKGPWRNAKGEINAYNLDELHGNNSLTKRTALNENGEVVNGRGDTPNRHDILTGSQPNGTAFPPGDDMTCGNYTKSGADGSVMLGHHDRMGNSPPPPGASWNSSHKSAGCSDALLAKTGSAGYLYCFASN